MILSLKTQAEKFYSAFNGRYFSEEAQSEIMHTVYLAELIKVKNLNSFDINQEMALMGNNTQVYFEELPVCPLCLEKLDNSVNGL